MMMKVGTNQVVYTYDGVVPKSGKSVCKIIIVVERKIGGSMKRSDYIPIALWAKKADVAKDLVCTGDELMVVGTVAQERWETADHDKRSRIVIQADTFWVIPPETEEYLDDEDDFEDDEVGLVETFANQES